MKECVREEQEGGLRVVACEAAVWGFVFFYQVKEKWAGWWVGGGVKGGQGVRVLGGVGGKRGRGAAV